MMVKSVFERELAGARRVGILYKRSIMQKKFWGRGDRQCMKGMHKGGLVRVGAFVALGPTMNPDLDEMSFSPPLL